jgi:FAD/FMN-containing dehydrogenase
MPIGPDDPRYRAIIDRQFNRRFKAHPDYVRIAGSADDVVSAVNDAVGEGRRLVVTSGGHCLEGFVSDPEVRVIVDVSPMTRVYHDAGRRAIVVEAGATVGAAFRALHDNWGTVVPFGEYPGIGIGGHVAGGAFGFLCRQLGLAADYLYAVEVVTVSNDGKARAVVATREQGDPNRELWWAHTGGGGGNFGIVTRYWFRAPDASGDDPSALLPRSPESIATFTAEWSWADLDRRSFVDVLESFGSLSERHSGVDSPFASLFTLIELHRQQFGKIVVRGVSSAGDAAGRQIDDWLHALVGGGRKPLIRERQQMTWLEFALNPFPDLFTFPPGGASMKGTDALLKKPFTRQQRGIVYDYLTRTDYDIGGGMLGLASYGGRVNVMSPDATASAQRAAIMDIACASGWLDPKEELANVAWVQAFYRDLFSETGGVPVPGDAYDGSLINHPNPDLADPAWNTSGVPWTTLYYKGNYARLQRVKARWDPRNVFRHALSIPLS